MAQANLEAVLQNCDLDETYESGDREVINQAAKSKTLDAGVSSKEAFADFEKEGTNEIEMFMLLESYVGVELHMPLMWLSNDM